MLSALSLQPTDDHYVGKPSAIANSAFHPFGVDKWVAKLSTGKFYLALVAPSDECLWGKAELIGLLAAIGAVCFWQPTYSGLNLVVAAVLHDSVCVIATLHGRLLCVIMLYRLCKVEWIVLTELSEDYYYHIN